MKSANKERWQEDASKRDRSFDKIACMHPTLCALSITSGKRPDKQHTSVMVSIKLAILAWRRDDLEAA